MDLATRFVMDELNGAIVAEKRARLQMVQDGQKTAQILCRLGEGKGQVMKKTAFCRRKTSECLQVD